jgi:hypothetical protein
MRDKMSFDLLNISCGKGYGFGADEIRQPRIVAMMDKREFERWSEGRFKLEGWERAVRTEVGSLVAIVIPCFSWIINKIEEDFGWEIPHKNRT